MLHGVFSVEEDFQLNSAVGCYYWLSWAMSLYKLLAFILKKCACIPILLNMVELKHTTNYMVIHLSRWESKDVHKPEALAI